MTKEQLKAEYEKAKKTGNIKEAGVGTILSSVAKLATRAVGGITGTGAKFVGTVYRNQGFSEAVLKQPAYTPRNSLGSNSATKKPTIKINSGNTRAR